MPHRRWWSTSRYLPRAPDGLTGTCTGGLARVGPGCRSRALRPWRLHARPGAARSPLHREPESGLGPCPALPCRPARLTRSGRRCPRWASSSACITTCSCYSGCPATPPAASPRPTNTFSCRAREGRRARLRCVKGLPGCKTDSADTQWVGRLLRASFTADQRAEPVRAPAPRSPGAGMLRAHP